MMVHSCILNIEILQMSQASLHFAAVANGGAARSCLFPSCGL